MADKKKTEEVKAKSAKNFKPKRVRKPHVSKRARSGAPSRRRKFECRCGEHVSTHSSIRTVCHHCSPKCKEVHYFDAATKARIAADKAAFEAARKADAERRDLAFAAAQAAEPKATDVALNAAEST